MNDDRENEFFVVWNPIHGAPSVRHAKYAAAEIEAQRLARQHRDKFYVLRSISVTKRVDVETRPLAINDDMPF